MDFESIDNMVADIMIEHGPDGHCDGSEYITRYIQSLLDKKDQQHKEQIELIIKYCQRVVEVQQLENIINNKE